MKNKTSNIPRELTEVFHHIQDELLLLYTKWNYFKTLYCTNDEYIKLLDESGKGFFVIHGDIMRDNIMMSICVLTDPASSRVGKETRNNLTLKHLVSLIPSHDSSITDKLNQILVNAEQPWKPFRSHRNRRISHFDLNTVLRKEDELLPNVSIDDVDRALSLIADVLNAIEEYYDDNVSAYHIGIYMEGNAKELMNFLQESIELEKHYRHKEFDDSLDEQC